MFLLLAISCFVYLRYASDLSNLHVEERLQHSRTLGLIWSADLYGSMLLAGVSLLGLGWVDGSDLQLMLVHSFTP